MGWDDLSDDDKQKLLSSMQNSPSDGTQDSSAQSTSPPDPSSTPSGIGSLNPQLGQSFASQNVSPDVSQSLNNNETTLDNQRAAKQAALDKLVNTPLTPLNQRIAEGMGGVGSLAVREGAPLVEMAAQEAAPYVQQAVAKAGPAIDEAATGIKQAFPKIQKWFQAGTKEFPAADRAQAELLHGKMEQNGMVGPNRTLVGPYYKQ